MKKEGIDKSFAHILKNKDTWQFFFDTALNLFKMTAIECTSSPKSVTIGFSNPCITKEDIKSLNFQKKEELFSAISSLMLHYHHLTQHKDSLMSEISTLENYDKFIKEFKEHVVSQAISFEMGRFLDKLYITKTQEVTPSKNKIRIFQMQFALGSSENMINVELNEYEINKIIEKLKNIQADKNG